MEDLPDETMVVGTYKNPDAMAIAQALKAAGKEPVVRAGVRGCRCCSSPAAQLSRPACQGVKIRVQDAFNKELLSQDAEAEVRPQASWPMGDAAQCGALAGRAGPVCVLCGGCGRVLYLPGRQRVGDLGKAAEPGA